MQPINSAEANERPTMYEPSTKQTGIRKHHFPSAYQILQTARVNCNQVRSFEGKVSSFTARWGLRREIRATGVAQCPNPIRNGVTGMAQFGVAPEVCCNLIKVQGGNNFLWGNRKCVRCGVKPRSMIRHNVARETLYLSCQIEKGNAVSNWIKWKGNWRYW